MKSVANYIISINDGKSTLFKSGWTGNHRLDADGFPEGRFKEFLRSYGREGWIVNFHNCLVLDDDRKTYLVEQLSQIMMARKGLDYFKVHSDALAVGIKSGWTEIFAVSLNQIRGYQGKAVQICKKFNWNFRKILNYIRNFCRQHFGSDNYAEYKYGEKVYRTTPFNRKKQNRRS
jgi:hypothetical protein